MKDDWSKRTIVTTGRKFHADSVTLAQKTAQKLDVPYVERKNASIGELRTEYRADLVLVAKKGLLMLETEDGEMFFHPNMAHLRLRNLRFTDQGDRMAEAMGLRAGMSVLDCTLGFAADAIVASFLTGAEGTVTGIESNPLIAEITGYGLAHFRAENYPIQEAMRRIRVISMDCTDFLRQAETDSYDIVYFDPMFRYPLMDSKNLNPLRSVADHRPISTEAIREAKRVARMRVVLKETAKSTEFDRLGFPRKTGGRYSKVQYGVIELAKCDTIVENRCGFR